MEIWEKIVQQRNRLVTIRKYRVFIEKGNGKTGVDDRHYYYLYFEMYIRKGERDNEKKDKKFNYVSSTCMQYADGK